MDVWFPLRGTSISADHGYQLYAAVCRHAPVVHGDEQIGIHPVEGRLVGDRRLELTPRSRLTVRAPVVRVPQLVPLAGKRLDLGGSPVTVGVPSTKPLRSAASLVSRLVVIKGFTEPDPFLGAVERQLEQIGVRGRPRLVTRRGGRAIEGGIGGRGGTLRRTLRIHDREIVGFAVAVEDLAGADALHLQAVGVGGRRRFGCGIFVCTEGDEQ